MAKSKKNKKNYFESFDDAWQTNNNKSKKFKPWHNQPKKNEMKIIIQKNRNKA